MKKCYRTFLQRKEKALRTKPIDFWKFLWSNSCIPNEISYNEVTSTNEQETVNLFSEYFSLVYFTKHIDLDAIQLDTSTFDLPINATFSIDDVICSLYALKKVWSIGLDGLSSHFLYQLR